MGVDIFGVYLIDFKNNFGGELSGRHYGVALSNISNKDDTFLVAPITSKKQGKKYRGGITINCMKYQKNPSCNKAFIKVRKIREVDKNRIRGSKLYDLDSEDVSRLKEKMIEFFKLNIE